MAIDLSELVHDDDFCTHFTVCKVSKVVWERGVPTQTRTSVIVEGIVLPASAKDLDMLPEGDRVQGMKTFITDECSLDVGNTEKTSDVCVWKGRSYKLISAWDYSANGYYKAVGSLMSEEG